MHGVVNRELLIVLNGIEIVLRLFQPHSAEHF